jgi:hypothetical protein
MIYEERTYTIKTGRVAEYLSIYEKHALPIQREVLGHLVGFFSQEFGGLIRVVHIWGYQSLDDRAARRAKLAAHPGWPGYLEKALPLIEAQENRVLVPTSFSPLK